MLPKEIVPQGDNVAITMSASGSASGRPIGTPKASGCTLGDWRGYVSPHHSRDNQ